MKIENLKVGYGSITFYKEIPPIPRSRKTTGNVTVNDEGRPGQPAHYRATYLISFDDKEGTLNQQNVFSLTVLAPEDSRDAPYSQVELEAAKRLPKMLRQLADAIETEIAPPEGENPF